MYQIYFRMTLHMFLTVFQSIIRSSILYIQQQTLVKRILLLYVQSNSWWWTERPSETLRVSQNNYQQDDTYGLSFISGLVVLHSTCFELQGAHHQEFTFLLYRQSLAYCVIFCCIPPVLLRVLFPKERVEYSKRLHSMPEAACTVKKWTPDDELPEARNM